MTWFTSDLHFSHKNVIKYCNRPYQSVDEMNEALISNWNSVVTPKDTIYILGDVFFCGEEVAESIVKRLNGNKVLIYGNHDKVIKKSTSLRSHFVSIEPDLYSRYFHNILTVLCHYPLLTWDRQHYGSFMLHGHSHGALQTQNVDTRRYDVGVDCNDYAPVHWDTIKTHLESIPLNTRNDRAD